jgi:hypothetical protein
LFFFLNNLCKYYPLKHNRFFMQQSPSKQQMLVAADFIEHIEQNPTLKERLTGALLKGGRTAIEEALTHPVLKPVFKIVLDTVEGWRNP